MKERPILFSGPMVRAILAGQKTQTRRVVKPQPEGYPDRIEQYENWPVRGVNYLPTSRSGKVGIFEPHFYQCPYGVPGDRLWVRETWGYSGCLCCPPHYRATEPLWVAESPNPYARWRPSIHMPRAFSRIALEIKAVRVERVQDISEADAIAEGMQAAGIPAATTNRAAFAKLWDKINAERGYGWAANPWVWVVGFKAVQQ